jgi:hypothetical protein
LPLILVRAGSNYDEVVASPVPEHIMSRSIPIALTAFQLALASAAAWLLYESEALGDGVALLILQ